MSVTSSKAARKSVHLMLPDSVDKTTDVRVEALLIASDAQTVVVLAESAVEERVNAPLTIDNLKIPLSLSVNKRKQTKKLLNVVPAHVRYNEEVDDVSSSRIQTTRPMLTNATTIHSGVVETEQAYEKNSYYDSHGNYSVTNVYFHDTPDILSKNRTRPNLTNASTAPTKTTQCKPNPSPVVPATTNKSKNVYEENKKDEPSFDDLLAQVQEHQRNQRTLSDAKASLIKRFVDDEEVESSEEFSEPEDCEMKLVNTSTVVDTSESSSEASEESDESSSESEEDSVVDAVNVDSYKPLLANIAAGMTIRFTQMVLINWAPTVTGFVGTVKCVLHGVVEFEKLAYAVCKDEKADGIVSGSCWKRNDNGRRGEYSSDEEDEQEEELDLLVDASDMSDIYVLK